ncbi:MAG: hemerythrin domain-containing protein [Inhella sp.]
MLRYFEIAAPHHHEDEERHVLPRLRAQGLDELADRIAADHQRMHGAWLPLRDQLFAVRRAQHPDCAEWPAFCALYRAHIQLEEGQAFPAAAARCDAGELQAMGAEMAGRRQAR